MELHIVEFEDLRAKGLLRFERLHDDLFQFVCKRFKPHNGEADVPHVMQITGATVVRLVQELTRENERLHKNIADNEKALRVLTEVLAPEMDAMNKAAAAREVEIALAEKAAAKK